MRSSVGSRLIGVGLRVGRMRALLRATLVLLPLVFAAGAHASTLSWPTTLQAQVQTSAQVATPYPLPADASLTATFSAAGTACWSVGSCVTVGSYISDAANSGHTESLLFPETAGVVGPSATVVGPPDSDGTDTELQTVACDSTGYCLAAGKYNSTTNGVGSPFLVPIVNGVPGTAVAVSLPSSPSSADPSTQGDPVVWNGASCPADGSCVVVGTYVTTDIVGTSNVSSNVPFVLTVIDGVPTVTEVTLPQGAFPYSTGQQTGAELNGVDCWSSTNCIAVGAYTSDSQGDSQPMVVPITVGSAAVVGQAVVLPALPSDQSTAVGNENAYLYHVACTQTGTCVAVGTYTVPAQATVATSSTRARTDSTRERPDSIGLPYGQEALVVPIIDGTLPGVVDAIPLPSDAPGEASGEDRVTMNAVSCADTGPCAAVGEYEDTSPNSHALYLPVSGSGAVGSADEVALPTDEMGNDNGQLTGVACFSSGDCVATGEYQDSLLEYHGLIASASGDVVAPATDIPLPNDDTAGLYSSYEPTIACAASAACFASGEYNTAAPFLLSLQTPLSVFTTSLPDGSVGSAYSQTLAATGAWGSYTWSLASGNLPAGLSLDPQTGVIAGTPTAGGDATFTVQVTGTGTPVQSATQPLSINVTGSAQSGGSSSGGSSSGGSSSGGSSSGGSSSGGSSSGGSGGSSLSSGSSSDGSTSSGGSTPDLIDAMVPSVRLALADGGLVSASRVTADVSCATSVCNGELDLVYSHRVKLRHGGHRLERTAIGRGEYSVPADGSGAVRVALDDNGRRFLEASPHHRLDVVVRATLLGGASAALPSSIHLAARRHRKK